MGKRPIARAARVGRSVAVPVNRLTAKSRIRKVIWRNGLSAVLPLHVQIRGDVVRKPLEESKHVDCRYRRRALHDPELLVVGFRNTDVLCCLKVVIAVCLTTLLTREWVSSVHMLARALLYGPFFYPLLFLFGLKRRAL